MRTCSVVGCKSLKQNPKTPLFGVPPESKLEWTAIVKNVTKQTRALNHVCLEHFSPDDVHRTYFALPNDVTFERKRFALKSGVVPTIFKGLCEITKPLIVFRKDLFAEKATKTMTEEENTSIREYKTLSNNQCQLVSPVKTTHYTSIDYYKLLDIFKEITLPTHWSTHKTEQGVTFYLPKYKTSQEKFVLEIEKQIVFSKNLDIDYYVNQKRIEPELGRMTKLEYPMNDDTLTEAIKIFNSKQICQGGPRVIDFPGVNVKPAKLEDTLWRHQECHIFTNFKKRCIRCENLYPYFRSYKRRLLMKKKKQIGPTLTPNRR